MLKKLMLVNKKATSCTFNVNGFNNGPKMLAAHVVDQSTSHDPSKVVLLNGNQLTLDGFAVAIVYETECFENNIDCEYM